MALSDDVKARIQQAYRDVLKGKSINARYGQRLMIAEIARYLDGITEGDGERTSAPSTCVVEAGTGTGKTLAYLMAAIPMAQAMGKKLVISTATVALQDQIVQKDLPDLRHHSKLKFDWALAKGRGRYLCLSRLEGRLHDEGVKDSDTMPLFLLEKEQEDEPGTRAFFEEMLGQYAAQKWDGDRDHWHQQIPDDIWKQVTTDHRQCTNRHCSYFDSCAFFEARKGLDDADVIVANHDLVLADLALGGGAILPKPEDTIFILDEAHHLPGKALNHFAASVSLNGSRQWLKQLSQLLGKFKPHLPASSVATKTVDRISEASRAYDAVLAQIHDVVENETPWDAAGDKRNTGQKNSGQQYSDRKTAQWRYPDGRLPDGLLALVTEAAATDATLTRHLGSLVDELQKALDDRRDHDIDRDTAEAWYPALASVHSRSEDQLRLWVAWRESHESQGGDDKSSDKKDNESQSRDKKRPPSARWAVRQTFEHSNDITLYSSPVLADSLLYSRLWSRAFASILTSATLTALGRFDRLQARAGLPESSHFLVVPSSFRYGDMASVEVPPMPALPTDGEAFTEALVARLPKLWEDQKAMLVLFTSRRQMAAVRDLLTPEWPGLITTQDDMSKAEVLRHHRDRIDAGQPSVLFGVASFAEGIDLPHDYLRHVVITRLPFAVPDDPIEASLAEWVTSRGGNPFMEITVPDASIKLVQAVGRLLRTESDYGRITILDRRIVTRRYGQLLLDSLPPFRRVIDA